jgi:hypothetical protein
MVRYMLRIDKETYEKIRALGLKKERSICWLINDAVKKYLKNN